MNYLERVKELKREWSTPPTDSDMHGVISVGSVKSPTLNDGLSDQLLSRLQAGTRWLTAHHQAWLDAKPDAACDERFSQSLAAWDEMERSLRAVYGYEGCVQGPDQRCPEVAALVCDSCAQRAKTKEIR